MLFLPAKHRPLPLEPRFRPGLDHPVLLENNVSHVGARNEPTRTGVPKERLRQENLTGISLKVTVHVVLFLSEGIESSICLKSEKGCTASRDIGKLHQRLGRHEECTEGEEIRWHCFESVQTPK